MPRRSDTRLCSCCARVGIDHRSAVDYLRRAVRCAFGAISLIEAQSGRWGRCLRAEIYPLLGTVRTEVKSVKQLSHWVKTNVISSVKCQAFG